MIETFDRVEVMRQSGEPRIATTFCRLSHAIERRSHVIAPDRYPGYARRDTVPLGRSPSQLRLRRGALAALFGSFFGTAQASDFPRLWLIAVRPVAFRCALQHSLPSAWQKDAGSPDSRPRCLRACAGSLTAWGPCLPHHCARRGVALGLSPEPRHPEQPAALTAGRGFRGSIPGPRVPLSTLRPVPCGSSRMTRGRRSWLSLQHVKLSFTIPCRF